MKVPSATYRVQFHSEFQFEHAMSIIEYIKNLGVSDVYASPLLEARKGSMHGYDVTNASNINPQIGGIDQFKAFTKQLHEHSLGMILDTVPNHMAASEENPWWRDVLEKGMHSAFANFFDVDWTPRFSYLQHKVMLPLLGEPFGQVLEKGQLQLIFEEGKFYIGYWDRRFPISLMNYPDILETHFTSFENRLGAEHEEVQRLRELIQNFRAIELSYSDREETERYLPDWRLKDLQARLKEIYHNHLEIQKYIDDVVTSYNGQEGIAGSFDMLEWLLHQQTYRLSYWKIAGEEINYRRFFNISDLICVRIENPDVFEETHRLIFQLIREGDVQGLRIDHVDGLYDPLGYLERLDRRVKELLQECNQSDDFYLVVEKILCEDESLPESWPVNGTSGYDFMTAIGGVFLDKKHLPALNDVYNWVCDTECDVNDLIYDNKKLVMSRLFAGEVRRLREKLSELAKHDRYARDLSISQLERAFVEVTACLPVYRNYAREYGITPRDAFYVQYAINDAKKRKPGLNSQALEFIRKVLSLDWPANITQNRKKEWMDLVMAWQQFTGPLMAKGLEDTSLYVYNRLTSLNDVGGDPSGETLSLEHFHQFNERRLSHWPTAMNATSTHDTKRSEDVRARIHALSEMPETLHFYLKKWFELNLNHKIKVRKDIVPDTNKEYLLYQTMLGFWPNDEVQDYQELIARLKDYMLKASREAKVFTSWMRPDEAYEKALFTFIDKIFDDPDENEFLQSFNSFHSTIAFYGAINSLTQVILKVCSPGVPDFYQGNELWDFSLVDPDNRRPVDYDHRKAVLAQMQQITEQTLSNTLHDLLEHWKDGRVKFFVTWKLLNFRCENQDLFNTGSYQPLTVEGVLNEHICAFVRHHEQKDLIVVVPRMVSTLSPPGQMPLGEAVWGNATLNYDVGDKPLYNIFTGQSFTNDPMYLKDVFSEFPVAVLTS